MRFARPRSRFLAAAKRSCAAAVKFRIGRIVYLSFSRDGTVMGFAFPKEWRDALVQTEAEKFSLPSQSDLRYHWVHVRLATIDADEMRELVEDAWRLWRRRAWPGITAHCRARTNLCRLGRSEWLPPGRNCRSTGIEDRVPVYMPGVGRFGGWSPIQ